MTKLMSKSELIQKIVEQHSNNMSLPCAGICKICSDQEACHEGAERHQSVYKGADHI
jgi:hypothetical protein